MNLNADLLGVINCLGLSYKTGLSGYDLFAFFLGSCVVVSLLIWYYGKISSGQTIKLNVSALIYDSKDILLQERTIESNYLIGESTSIWVKAIIYVLIVLVATTPLFKLFGLQLYI